MDTNTVIFTDVFDTILLRNAVSEHARQVRAAKLLSASLKRDLKHDIETHIIVAARRASQSLAYRAQSVGGDVGDVRLVDIADRLAALFDIEATGFRQHFLAAEHRVEWDALRSNRSLVALLKREAAQGRKIYAVSDTALPASSVLGLIRDVCGDSDWLTGVYSSADCQKTKRQGELFHHVLQETGCDARKVVHIGDDEHSDVKRAGEAGLQAVHLPRDRFHRVWIKANSVLSRVSLGSTTPHKAIRPSSAREFGHRVLGPIMGEYCLKSWLYLSGSAAVGSASVALYCARGGLPLRMMFERFLQRSGLPTPMPLEDFMVSRFVSAKAALTRRSEYVFEEIEREYQGSSLAFVLNSFSDLAFQETGRLAEPFSKESLSAFLDGPSSQEFHANLKQHDALFGAYFDDLVGGKDKIVLIDTGLYGSTHRFMTAWRPDVELETLLIARSNYKRFDERHFSRTTGLLSEEDIYTPFETRSSILRYWQLIEEVFEPDLESVRQFERRGDQIVSNLEADNWRAKVDDHQHPIFLGIMDYFSELEAGSAPKVLADAEAAWASFNRIILKPTRKEVEFLLVRPRSRDFGHRDYVDDRSTSTAGKFAQVRSALWRQGALRVTFPRLAPLARPFFGLVYNVRGLRTLRQTMSRKLAE